MTAPHTLPTADAPLQIPSTASVAYNVGDLCYLNSGALLPAGSQADAGTDGQNQRTFAANFVGVSNGKKLAADNTTRTLPVIYNQIVQMPCASATFKVGDLLGVVVAAGVLNPQKVVAVTDPQLAIAIVAQAGTLVTSVWMIPLTPFNRAAMLGTPTGSNTRIENIRTRVTLAQVNAGLTLLAARPGYKFRLVACDIIAIGGAAAAGTTVDILATQATVGVKLVAFAQASLTQSTVLKDGGSGAAVLADGASYVDNDVNTAITIGKTGSSFTTATNFDVNLSYVADPV